MKKGFTVGRLLNLMKVGKKELNGIIEKENYTAYPPLGILTDQYCPA